MKDPFISVEYCKCALDILSTLCSSFSHSISLPLISSPFQDENYLIGFIKRALPKDSTIQQYKILLIQK